jgi:hypothetical protein
MIVCSIFAMPTNLARTSGRRETEPPASLIYRRFFTPSELRRLDSGRLLTLSHEICLIRILLSRLLAAASTELRKSIAAELELLRVVASSGRALALLIRLELKIAPDARDDWLAWFASQPL